MGQLAHQLGHPARSAQPVDARDVVVGELDALDAQAPARPILGAAASLRIGELVVRDREQPRVRAPAPPVIAPPRSERAANVSEVRSAASSASRVRHAKKASSRSK
jgi:hypothetical protein